MSNEGVRAPSHPPGKSHRWVRAAGLLGLTMGTVVFAPSVLVGLPFVLLAVFLPGPGSLAWIAASLFLLVIMVPASPEGMWYFERGWGFLVGGWFAAITWRWPSARFTHRGLAAIGAATLLVAAYFGLNPETGEVVNWLIRSKVGGDMAAFVEGLRVLTDVDPELIAAFDRFFASQIRLYPSLVALSSFAALGVAWWLYIRLSHGRSDGLGPLRDFGFPDALVWVVVSGVGLVLVGTAWTTLVGYNTLLFMGALYALRGLAVVAFFKGGLTIGGALLAGLVTLLAAPVMIGAAVVIGLGDTWLGLRARAETAFGDS